MKNINIEYVDIDELKFAEYNPRKASKKEWEDLKKSIQKFGFIAPVIVNNAENRKNIIVGGHFRVKVAKELGIKAVPVVYVNIPDIEKEKELNLRLNKNTGEWDWDLLANFDDDLLKEVGFDISGLDFLNDVISENEEEEKEISIKFICENTSEVKDFLEKLKVQQDFGEYYLIKKNEFNDFLSKLEKEIEIKDLGLEFSLTFLNEAEKQEFYRIVKRKGAGRYSMIKHKKILELINKK